MLIFRRLATLFSVALFCVFFTGCSPLVPGNFLGPSTVRTPQKLQGKWMRPRLIPVNAAMLDTLKGKKLLAPALKPQLYRIGPYDNLNVIVWGHPEISTVATANIPMPVAGISSGSGAGAGEVISSINASSSSNPAIIVESDGTIFYPYIGHMHVAGMTLKKVQSTMTHRLSAYIRHPQVTVQVAKFRNRHAYVLGEVKVPGMLPLTDKPLTLMEAISNSGGINPATADPAHIYLIRGSWIRPDIFWLDAQTPQSLMIAEHFPLRENDIVYVSAATLNSWNNFINQILPSFSTYFIAKGLAN